MLIRFMRLLFAISMLSFCAVFWAVLTVAKRLRVRGQKASKPRTQAPLQEIFEAGEFRTPRSLRLIQNLDQNVAQHTTEQPAQQPTEQALPAAPLAARRRDDRAQSSQSSDLNSSQPAAPEHLASPLLPLPKLTLATRPPEAVFVERRKAPQSVRPAIDRRADLALYNKDLGDLADPQPQPLRSATGGRTSPLNRS
jgi:hypothetical protein